MTEVSVLAPQPESPVAESRAGGLERRITMALTIIPFLGVCIAIPLLWGHGVTGLDLALLIGGYLFAGFGITIGYHRYFTHQSFEARQVLRIALAVAGAFGIEGGVIGWTATHRRHHAMSDREGDPHSPHLEEKEGFLGIVRGLWHSHMGWLFKDNDTVFSRWAPDLIKDAAIVKVDRLFPLLATASYVLPAAIGLAVTRSFWGMLTAFLWGGLVRTFFLHHVTWSINSICHFYGNRPFESKDLSTNNWPLALISLGESWHNNHHAFPTSARHGLLRGQVDISAMLIRAFDWLGLADEVRLPTPKQMDSRRRSG